MPYHWNQAPPAVHSQVERVAEALEALFGSDLVGLYLHGSLAMGCFNPAGSDIDLIAVIEGGLSPEGALALARRFLALSGHPSPLEFHLLRRADLAAWRFPTPFAFHYSEGWRERWARAIAEGRQVEMIEADPDLAAHLTILHHRGVVLRGAPIAALFPAVDRRDYLRAIWELDTGRDNAWMAEHPVYGVLSLCRVMAYVAEGRVTSKEEGGAWALDAATAVPPALKPVVAQALALYRGEEGAPGLDPGALRAFVSEMRSRIEQQIRAS